MALSTALIYPFFFLYTTNLTNGTAKLPTHEWQAVQPFEGPETVTPVMVMRPLWVHGKAAPKTTSSVDARHSYNLLSSLTGYLSNQRH